MNWPDVGSKIVQYAPLAAAALSSPVGAVSVVAGMIANMFGVKAQPEDVMKAIIAYPDGAKKIQEEMLNNIEFQKVVLETVKENNRHEEQELSISASNTDSARKNSVNVNSSPVDNWIKVVLVISEVGLLALSIVFFFFYRKDIDQTATILLGSIIGSLTTLIGSKDNYYWGSSSSSQKKDEALIRFNN